MSRMIEPRATTTTTAQDPWPRLPSEVWAKHRLEPDARGLGTLTRKHVPRSSNFERRPCQGVAHFMQVEWASFQTKVVDIGGW